MKPTWKSRLPLKRRITSLLPSTKKRGKKLSLDERIEKALDDLKRESKKIKRKPKRKKSVGVEYIQPTTTPNVIIKKKSVSVDKV